MGFWEVVLLIVIVTVLGGVATQYIKMQSGRKEAGDLTTRELRELVQEAVREEIQPIRDVVRRLEGRIGESERPRSLGTGEGYDVESGTGPAREQRSRTS